MINKHAIKYCCEDVSLIENYAEAISDSKMWDCHHRAETDEVLTKKDLISQGRYWKRPASELIFLTKSAHLKLHFDSWTMENQREASRKACAETGKKTGRKTGASNGRKSAWKHSKKVLQYSKDGTFIREWSSAKEVERQLGFHQSSICEVCNGKRKTANGYLWRYANAV